MKQSNIGSGNSQMNGLNGSRKGKNLLLGNDDDEIRSNPEMKIVTKNNKDAK